MHHIVKLGPKKPKKCHLGPKMMMLAMESAVHIVSLGPKILKTGHLGPKNELVTIKKAQTIKFEHFLLTMYTY